MLLARTTSTISKHLDLVTPQSGLVGAGLVGGQANFVGRQAIIGVTIGSFDGFHSGHQALFARLQDELKSMNPGTSRRALLTFEPHPRQFFGRNLKTTNNVADAAESRPLPTAFLPLMTTREKIEYVRSAGFDYFIAQRFNAELAALSPEQFVEQLIVRDLGAKLVVVGYDWAFGKGREGSPEKLQQLGARFGFRVVIVEPVVAGGEKISSSRVRDALGRGEMEQVASLLLRPYSLMGRVVHGDKRGRTIGFPTANLVPQRKQLPPRGVYATNLIVDGKSLPAVTNIGVRPTFGESTVVVETHVLAGEHELYSKLVTVEFLSRLRDERTFAGKAELTTQIAKDCEAAAAVHRSKHSK